MHHKDGDPKEDHDPKVKKPYEPPVLTVYGTVRELTKTQGRRTRDGGHGFQRTNHV